MPVQMVAKVMRLAPTVGQAGNPGHTVTVAALHFHHMSDRMNRPCIGWIGLNGSPTERLRAVILACFLKGETIHPLNKRVVAGIAIKTWQHAEIGRAHV